MHEHIYAYAGEDYLLPPFVSMNTDVKVSVSSAANGDYTITRSSREVTDEVRLDLASFAWRRAYEAMKQHKNYATTMAIQKLLDVYGDYITTWQKANGDSESWQIRPIFRQFDNEDINNKDHKFDDDWMPKEEPPKFDS